VLANCLRPLDAQQVVIGTPQIALSESYYETTGFGWQVFGPGFFFQRGFSPALPPPVPSLGGMHVGWGGRIGPLRYRAQFFAAQGFQSTYSTTVPMLTVTNGSSGYLFHGAYRPFILESIPLAGLPADGVSGVIYEQPSDRSDRPGVVGRQTEPGGVVDDPPVRIERIPPKDDPPLVLGKPAR
jgi:hypothetical protein